MRRSRIFLASIDMQPRGEGPGSGIWAVNLRDPLVDLGHDVVTSAMDWDTPLGFVNDRAWQQSHRADNSDRLLKEVRTAHREKPLDLFLSYFYDAHVEPGAIREIRKMGIPAVNFYCNAAHQFHLVQEIAPAYDYCWVPERLALPYYRAAGANPIHIQMGANPTFYRPLPGITRDVSVAFMGMLYSDRAQWLARIYRRGIPVRVFTRSHSLLGGGGASGSCRSLYREASAELRANGPADLARRATRYWTSRKALRKLQPALAPAVSDMVQLFNRSEAVLNLSHVYDRGEPGGRVKAHVRLREFEAPLCRALFCPQWCDELELYYDLDREVLCWRSVEELRSKLRYYLTHEAEAEKVREAGYRRALSEHTAHHRFGELFRGIGLG